MAIDLGDLKDRYKDINQMKLVLWVTWATQRGLDKKQVMKFIDDLAIIKNSPEPNIPGLKSRFKNKWNVDPDTGKTIELHEPEEIKNELPKETLQPVPSVEKEVTEVEPKSQSESEVEEMAIVAADNMAQAQAQEEAQADNIEEPSEEEIQEEINGEETEEPDHDENETDEDFEEEIPDEVEFDIPYKNPITQKESAPPVEPIKKEPEPKPESTPIEDYEEMEDIEGLEEESEPDFSDEDAFITKKITHKEYESYLSEHKYILEALEKDPQAIVRFAQEIDLQRHPPYMQIRSYLINHPVKDPNNTTVMIYVKNDFNKDQTQLQTMPLVQAMEITKQLEEEGFLTSMKYNYRVIFDKFEENIKVLASLIYSLEIYCETQDKNPFKINIPREELARSFNQTMKTSYADLKKILVNEVLKHILGMKSDIVNQFSDVNDIIKNNMDIMNSDVREIAEKVMKKVKTDLDQTNKEDVKRGHLFIFNKRRASYKLTAGVSGFYNMMLDDLENDLMNKEYKIDRIKTLKKYTIEEVQNLFNYKNSNTIRRAVLILKRHKLIIMYTDGTFCLSI
jgi:hypothetical protein